VIAWHGLWELYQQEKHILYATEWKLNALPTFYEHGSQDNIPLLLKK
jgi:hypothetical protein